MNLKSSALFTNRNVAETLVKEISKIKKKTESYQLIEEIKGIPIIKEEIPDQKIEEIVTKNIGGGATLLTKEDA